MPTARPSLADLVAELSRRTNAARDAHVTAIATLKKLTEDFTSAERRRAAEKMAAIVRLASQPHPANASKQISISQAEDFAQLDPAYLAYKQECDRLGLARTEAELLVEAARIGAEHAVTELHVAGSAIAPGSAA